MADSILQKHKRCLICHTEYNLHCHHVYEGIGRRQISDKWGLTVWLCANHHNMSNYGVHSDKAFDRKLKQWAQKKAMAHYSWTTEDFIKIIGKNYL